MSPTNLLTSISKDAEDAMKIDPPAPTTPASPTPETFAEAEAHAPPPDVTPPSAPSPNVPDAKAS